MEIMLRSGEALFKAGKLVAGFFVKAVTFVITVALVKYFGVMLLFPWRSLSAFTLLAGETS
jgi:hypothetical protein